jgi:hypothetical protein
MGDDPPKARDKIVNLVERAVAVDERAVAATEGTLAAAGEAVFLAQMAPIVEQIQASGLPLENHVAGALHLALRDIDHARLPAAYRDAVVALQECARIDECWDWQSKAEALASYARQAKDQQLLTMAARIRLRAIRRCGELLNAIKAATPGRKLKSVSVPAPNSSSEPEARSEGRFRAAAAAGLSRGQAVTALRAAHIPTSEFERAVESDRPPSLTILTRPERARTETHLISAVVYTDDEKATIEERGIERQVALLMSVWKQTEHEARKRFLAIIGVSADR